MYPVYLASAAVVPRWKASFAGVVDFHLVDGPVDALLRTRLGDADKLDVCRFKFNFCPRLFPEPTGHLFAPMLAVSGKLYLVVVWVIDRPPELFETGSRSPVETAEQRHFQRGCASVMPSTVVCGEASVVSLLRN